jgi:glutamate-ammonia-ligase adenylyltransferase
MYEQSPKLLQAEPLPDEQVYNLLAPVGFANWQQAHRCLRRIDSHRRQAHTELANCLPSLLLALANTATPDQVLVSFERFVHSANNATTLLDYLAHNPRGFEILFTVFTGSQYLTEILLRHPTYFEQLIDRKQLTQIKDLSQLQQATRTIISHFIKNDRHKPNSRPAVDALRRFQRRELLRLGTCDLLGLLDLPTVTIQLSHLADSLVQACLMLAAHQTQTDPQGFAVIAMGKLGGREVNYSSDIDLLFLATSKASTYFKLGRQLIEALGRPTGEGFLYRVDMRLRPWGRSGALVYSLDAHLAYLQKQAGLWERQALLKARTIAGDLAVGQEFLQRATPLIFNTGDQPVRSQIHKLKQRIENQLRKRGRNWGEVKLGQGSIRDIEFVTQYLQLVHGDGKKRSSNTLKTLADLSTNSFLPADEYRVLADGYIFLRTVEHHLQLMHYRQTHTLPGDEQALTHLARRLGFQGPEAGAKFKARYQQHSAVIRAVYQRHLTDSGPDSQLSSPGVLPLLVRMPPAYVETFSDRDIEHHARLIERLDHNKLVEVEATPLDDDHWQVIVVGYDYLGELSLICGLLFVHGFNIIAGDVFTYGPPPIRPAKPGRRKSRRRSRTPSKIAIAPSRRKIVDVFTVRPVQPNLSPAALAKIWTRYTNDLTALMQRLQRGQQRQAQGELAKRVAVALPQIPGSNSRLYPVDIDIDNEISDRHTILRIESVDTVGFLYEFTNALALTGINVRRMTVASVGNRVQDTLYVTDAQQNKITSAEKQRELRVATVLIKHFTQLLPRSPNPEAALLHFREFIGRLFMRPDWPDEIASLEQPEVLVTLARLLGVSDFLWNDFLRMQHANLFSLVRDAETLVARKSKADLQEKLALALQGTAQGKAQHDALNTFKDREMFRIDMRQIQGHITEFGQFSAELTDLAEVVVTAAYQLAAGKVKSHYGLPQLTSGHESPLSVCALGKYGGRELGFASDIELMFIFAGSGQTTGPRVITTTEYYVKLIHEVSQIIQAWQEGIFEVDLRLRPYGKAGAMAVSLDSFRRYFGSNGDAWPYERQALVKLRPIAGNLKLGQQVIGLRDELIYTGEPFDVTAMRAMRERQLRHLVTAGAINAKFSPGGLVDVEYLVQGLQISHGHRDPSLRQPNTDAAMQALAAANIIPAADYPRLRKAHIFLRRLINALRMVRGNAKDLTVPAPNDEEFAFLARRLNYGQELTRLQEDLARHTTYVQELSLRLLG